MAVAELTVTSYAVLGLLALGDWTTYELAAQMRRTLDFVWPRAERGLYDEPKRLVAAGYARGRKEMTGRRPRTVYSITPSGRKALKAWLGSDVMPPRLEFEGLLRVLFADQGDLAQLRASLHLTAEQAAVDRARFAEMAAGMLRDGGAFPERVHVNTLGMRFMIDYYDHIVAWTEWALAAIDSWDDVRSAAHTWSKPAREILEAAAGNAAATPPVGT
jgi:DNA-binding PadR family transcriptional regulator